MNSVKLAGIGLLAVFLAFGIWFLNAPTEPSEATSIAEAPVFMPESIAPAPAADSNGLAAIDMAVKSSDLPTLRRLAIESDGPWSQSLRSRIMNLRPADLLDFLDDDDLLVRSEARDLVRDIYGVCGVALGLLKLEDEGLGVATNPEQSGSAPTVSSLLLTNPGIEWCRRMALGNGVETAYDKMGELLEVFTTVDPSGSSRKVRAREALARSREQGDQAIRDLLRSNDALIVAMASDQLWHERRPGFVDDWRPMEVLSQAQADQVRYALYITLECRFLSDCSMDSLPVSGLCLTPGFQCADQVGLEGILYQSFSPKQNRAYDALMAAINRHRRRGRAMDRP